VGSFNVYIRIKLSAAYAVLYRLSKLTPFRERDLVISSFVQRKREMCQENVSAVNGVAFALLIVASLLCTLSFSAPFWVYYPTRHGVPELANRLDNVITRIKYPFEMASWRGLWAACFKEHVGDRVVDEPLCVWFWDNEFSLWKTIPSKCCVYRLQHVPQWNTRE